MAAVEGAPQPEADYEKYGCHSGQPEHIFAVIHSFWFEIGADVFFSMVSAALFEFFDMYTFYTGPSQQVDAVAKAVEVVEYHAPYAGLYDELGTLEARATR